MMRVNVRWNHQTGRQMASKIRSLDIGHVLGATFGIIGRHPIVFLGLSLIVAGLPYGLAQYFMLSPEFTDGTLGAGFFDDFADAWIGIAGFGAGLFILYFILMTLLQAMLIVASIRDLRGQEVDIGTCLSEALNHLLPLVGLAILSMLGIIAGLFLFLVPGIILLLMWIVATPVLVAENQGVVDSLTRSNKLTSGSKGRIFLLLIIFLIASTMISGLGEALGYFSTTASVITTTISETITAAVQAAGIAALYIELRTIKEGPLNEGLAEIFA